MQKALFVKVTVRLPADVHAELQEVAHEQRRSLNAALVVAAERYIRQMRYDASALSREEHDPRMPQPPGGRARSEGGTDDR